MSFGISKDLARYIDKIDERFIIANIDSNQDVLAIACLEKQNKDLYLDILYVSKYARRKGYGEKCLVLSLGLQKKMVLMGLT